MADRNHRHDTNPDRRKKHRDYEYVYRGGAGGGNGRAKMWTEEEALFLAQYRGAYPIKALAMALGRSWISVQRALARLDGRHDPHNKRPRTMPRLGSRTLGKGERPWEKKQ
jgi:hypothetical protein